MQTGCLSKLDGNASPHAYAEPDSGFLFRFPFPDEDELPFGEVKGSFQRGEPVNIDDPYFDSSIGQPGITMSQLDIVQQKLVHRQSDHKLCLAVVFRNPASGDYFRLEEDDDVKRLLKQIVKFQINPQTDPQEKKFYRQIALRILKGYRLDSPAQTLERKKRNNPPPLPAPDDSSKKLRR